MIYLCFPLQRTSLKSLLTNHIYKSWHSLRILMNRLKCPGGKNFLYIPGDFQPVVNVVHSFISSKRHEPCLKPQALPDSSILRLSQHLSKFRLTNKKYIYEFCISLLNV